MLTRNISRQCTSNPRSHSFFNSLSFVIRASQSIAVWVLAVGLCLPSLSSAQTKNDDWLKEGLPDKILGKKKEKEKLKDPDGIPGAAKFQLTKKIIPALQAGDESSFLKAMVILVSNQDESVIEAVEKFAIKNKLGSLKERFSNSLIRFASSGMKLDTQSLKPAMVEYATTGVNKLVEDELAELEKHMLMQDPLQLPISWGEREQMFWDVHVWKNRFLNINRLVGFSKQVQQPLLDRAIKIDNEEEIEKRRAVFVLEKRVRSIYRDMKEREAELRLMMLAEAEKTLRESKAADKRINAAFALELSGAELDLLFKAQKPGSFERERLNAENILNECDQLLASGRKHGQDAIQKALLLRIGAHWWLRGRYGSSTEAFGLLKPMQAMNNQALMHGLYMPKSRPEAIGFVYPESGDQSTGYDRRHYYTWALEHREVIRKKRSVTETDSVYEETADVRSRSFW